MKVKRIFAPDMRQAMRRVREEIGPDAVIVSNHRVAGGVEIVAAREDEYEAAQAELRHERERRREEQMRVFNTRPPAAQESRERSISPLEAELARTESELTQAHTGHASSDVSRNANRQLNVDGAEELQSILASLRKQQRLQEQRAAARPAPEAPPRRRPPPQEEYRYRDEPITPEPAPVPRQDDQLIQSMQQEIHELKSLLQQQLVASQQPAKPARDPDDIFVEQLSDDVLESRAAPELGPLKAQLEKRLLRLGIGERLIRQLLAPIESDLTIDKAWRNTLSRLADALPVFGEELIERGGMIAFIGPTGAGKTTTIGKLAARYVLQHGSASVALVTTDCFRIAAHEQLKTFGRILDVPVRVVDENHSLEEVLQTLKGKRLVLIDTAGMNAQDPAGELQVDMLSNLTIRIKKLLVLSCSSQRQLLESAYQNYAPIGLSGCVLSKTDESGSLGEALTLAVEKQLPIAYIADGQKIPDDIGLARRNDLVSRAVVTAQRDGERQRQAKDRIHRAG